MSFSALSILLSASEDRLPVLNSSVVASCLGLPTSISESRPCTLAALSSRRENVLEIHSTENPSVELFEDLEKLPKGSLNSLARAHGLRFESKQTNREKLRTLIAEHLSHERCTMREGLVSHLACASVVNQFDAEMLLEPDEDPSTLLQIHLLRQITPVLKLKSLRRLLDLHDVKYDQSDKVKQLRRRLHQSGKQSDGTLSLRGSAKRARAKKIARLREEWPQLVPEHLKWRLLDNFNFHISADKLRTFVCGSCAEACPVKDQTLLPFDVFDLDLLKRPDRLSNQPAGDSHRDCAGDLGPEDSDEESADENDDPRARSWPWLDPDVEEPPMPMAENTGFVDVLLEPGCLGTDPETGHPALICCRHCAGDLKKDRVPAKAVSNRNYLGPVPPELKDLTVVEEAMIALCRVKCWIIQLRDDDPHMATTQRGVRGHIIVYPQRPSSIATSLPLSLEDVITPICVIL
ncbi:hypothetical protein B0H11DRAFT_1939370 [Mycena galericulata]|nr:hypothetical protein B0H11DRAFT_1939370 [Mycena galericulata]